MAATATSTAHTRPRLAVGRWGLLLLLAARLALGAAYALIVPVWEAYDEDGHFAYARYLAVYRRLLQPGDPEAEKIWERFQPPLYYALMAPVLAPFDLGDTFDGPPRNPLFVTGEAGVNYALHTGDWHPENEVAAAARAARLAGVLLSTLSVPFVFWGARRLWSGHPGRAWLATVLYAFWPQYLFIGSMITNDLLVTAFAAVWFYLITTFIYDGFGWRRALALAAVLAAALLTKLNGAALLPATGVALWLGLTTGRGARPAYGLLLLGVAAVAAAALAFLGSLRFVTAQVFQLETMTLFVGNLAQLAAPAGELGDNFTLFALRYGFRTFIASFGWGNLETFPWLYVVWAAGVALAVAGWLWPLLQRAIRRAPRAPEPQPRRQVFFVLALFAVTLLVLTLSLAVAHQSVFLVPGRYLLPMLPAVCVLLVAGWARLVPAWAARRAGQAAAYGLVTAAWAIPFVTLAPAYARPQPLAGEVPAPLTVRFGESIELVGYAPLDGVRPGERAVFTLCWRARQPVDRDYAVLLQVVGPDGQGHGRLLTYPGRGNYPTSMWMVGETFCDDYAVLLSEALPSPSAAWVQVALMTTPDPNGPRLPAFAPDGVSLPPEAVGFAVKVPPVDRPAALAQAANVRFGDYLLLRDYAFSVDPANSQAYVTLRWEMLRALPAQHVVFVHLRDTPATAYAQSDFAGRLVPYPLTMWAPGEVILDEHVLALPPGPAPPLALVVGVYDPAAGVRLPAFDEGGAQLPNGEAWLAEGLTLDLAP